MRKKRTTRRRVHIKCFFFFNPPRSSIIDAKCQSRSSIPANSRARGASSPPPAAKPARGALRLSSADLAAPALAARSSPTRSTPIPPRSNAAGASGRQLHRTCFSPSYLKKSFTVLDVLGWCKLQACLTHGVQRRVVSNS